MTTAESFPFDPAFQQDAEVIQLPVNSKESEVMTADEHTYATVHALMLGHVVKYEVAVTDHEAKLKSNEQILADALPPEARHSPQWFDLSQR